MSSSSHLSKKSRTANGSCGDALGLSAHGVMPRRVEGKLAPAPCRGSITSRVGIADADEALPRPADDPGQARSSAAHSYNVNKGSRIGSDAVFSLLDVLGSHLRDRSGGVVTRDATLDGCVTPKGYGNFFEKIGAPERSRTPNPPDP